MSNINLSIDDTGQGAFYITEEGKNIGEMVMEIKGNDMTVFHTEVLPEHEGKGLAKELLTYMVDYAKKNNLKVIALCPYVHLQFKRHPELYNDVWKKE